MSKIPRYLRVSVKSLALAVVFACWASPAFAQMTMPPADLCAGVAGATVVAAGDTLILDGARTCLSVYGTLELRDGAVFETLHSHPGSLVRASAGTIRVADVSPTDVGQFTTGIVLEGRVEFAGALKTSWTRLTEELKPGQSVIRVEDASGWLVGDRITVADTRDQRAAPTPESFTVVALSGLAVTLDHAAALEHPASRDVDGVLERFAPVANTTRSLVIRSLNPTGTRAHVMVTTKATGYIRNVELADMGRTTTEPLNLTTNVKGRYTAHLHFLETSGFEFSGNAIHDALKWGITVHHSNGHVIRDNVVVRAQGVGVMTEDGTEADNAFDHNLALDITGLPGEDDARGAQSDWGWNRGHGFWLQGPMNRVTRNVVANARGAAFDLWGRATPNQPLREFSDNESAASGKGVIVWFVGSNVVDSVIDRFYEWHSVGEGFYGYPSYRLVLQDWTGRGDPRILSPDGFKSGISFGDYSAGGLRIVRPNIQHKTYGIWLPYGNASGGGTTLRETPITGGLFAHNVWAVVTIPPSGSYDPIFQVPFRSVLTGVKFQGNTKADLYRWDLTGGGANRLQLQQVDVIDHNGVVGDSFRLFYPSQAPSAVMPSGDWIGSKHPGGPDYTGLTNAQISAQFGAAQFGEIATCATTRPGVVGFVCPLGATPPSPPPPPALTLHCGEDVSIVSAGPVAVPYVAPHVMGGLDPVATACQPLAGSLFALGVTTVSCSALDTAAQQASCTLQVSVLAPPPPPPPPPATSWRCSVPSAVTVYSNGDKKITARCPSTLPVAKGDTVQVAK